MKLGEKQELFMRLLPRLIDKAHELGFEIRGGDLFRDPRVHGQMNVKQGYGAPNSCHKLKLAIDLNLFKDGAFIQDGDILVRTYQNGWQAGKKVSMTAYP